MTEDGRNYEGGLCEVTGGAGDGDGGAYHGFVAYESSPTSSLTLVHVTGLVRVPNPGVTPVLSYAVPQGINPDILLLRLDLVQAPGFWPSVLVMKPVTYVAVALGGPYSAARITNPNLGDHTVPFTR